MAKIESPSHKNTGNLSIAKGSGKRSKYFLDQKEALELAASIGGVQEDKALSKAAKHRQSQSGQPRSDLETETRTRITAKGRIKEKKALLVAQRVQSKKDKAKRRKAHRLADQDLTPSMESKPVRKRVSFA